VVSLVGVAAALLMNGSEVRIPPAATPAATPSGASGPPQPHTPDAARAAIVQALDAYADGDYGTSWDMWTRQAKAEVSRADYVRRHKLCRPFFEGQGVRWKVLEVTVFGDWAVVRASRETSVLDYSLFYQDGRWREDPGARLLLPYRTKTIEQIVSDERSAGRCSPA
jgi:hypothetical protein